MSMSTYVVGYREVDEQWKKMKQAWNACMDAKVDLPEDVYSFFDGEDPNTMEGKEVDIEEHDCVSEYNDETRNGYQVDVSKIPKDIKFIRFVNSW